MIKQTLFTDWHFMRWLRLGFGIILALQAIKIHDTVSGFIAIFFLFQAVINTGCCVVCGFAVQSIKNNKDKVEEVEFKEVKTIESK